jgi:preprotein translocase subunit SecD
VQIRPGTVIVEAQKPEYVPHPKEDKYYVVNDDPALSNADVIDPQAATDAGLGGTGQPDVSFAFSSRGARLFDLLTRQIAHRGELVARTGVPAPESYQHYAVVVDDHLSSVPVVDYLENPDGLNASAGSRIVGGFTDVTAQDLASTLRYRPLPVSLLLESVRNPAAVRKPAASTPPEGIHRGR